MPDFMHQGNTILQSFAVGVVDKSNMIDGSRIACGDMIVGIGSSGIHSNGYSLVRKLFSRANMTVGLCGRAGHDFRGSSDTDKNIFKACNAVLSKHYVNGILHITGGGFFENIPRIMPKGLGVSIKTDSWERPLIFKYIESKGNIEEKEMFSTFNMGVGMMMVVKPEIAQEVVEILSQAGEKAFIIGEVVKGEGVALV